MTEFVFAVGSTITISVDQQPNLIALGLVPADYPQSITVYQALCRDITGKDRLKVQRAVTRSFIDEFQSVDGFKYFERQAFNKDGTDGARFKYVCIDSLQNRDRKSNTKKDENNAQERKTNRLPTYDCGGAIHIKFSTKRDAINVIYKHNPIHRDVQSRPVNIETLDRCVITVLRFHPIALGLSGWLPQYAMLRHMQRMIRVHVLSLRC